MIFVGPNLSKPNSHFVTNIVSSIGSGDDLLIDLCDHGLKMNEIVTRVKDHCASKSERLVIYNAWEDEKFPLLFRKFFPELQLVTFFSDDEWRHENYDRYLALYSNLFTIAVKDHLPKYRAYGFDNVHYMQWGCNEKNFYPLENEEKIFDVTFIGAAYGKRIDYVKFLKHQGVEIKVFGSGWDKVKEVREYWGGVLTHQGMIKVISQSKINLNFLWTSRGDGNTTIKGRTMEIAACKAFQLSNPTYEFSNYGFVPDENIAVFKDEIDLLKKIQHYINDSHEREKIADNSYRHVLKNLTWKNQFDKVFSRMEMVQTLSVLKKFRVMVVGDESINPHIKLYDSRLEIQWAHPNSQWHEEAARMDGVISLNRKSTLNNETLYMMVFGLEADQSDIIASNFYVNWGKGAVWIRFIDRFLDRKRGLFRFLPVDCLMFSGKYAAVNSCRLHRRLGQISISYIEFPSFLIEINFITSRILRLYFASRYDSRRLIIEAMKGMRIFQAISILSDKLWQKILN